MIRPLAAGGLNQVVRVYRAVLGPNIGGERARAWSLIVPETRARVRPLAPRDEQVLAAKLSGRALYEITVRGAASTRQIDTDCVVEDARDFRRFAVRAVTDPTENGRWIILLAEEAGPDLELR